LVLSSLLKWIAARRPSRCGRFCWTDLASDLASQQASWLRESWASCKKASCPLLVWTAASLVVHGIRAVRDRSLLSHSTATQGQPTGGRRPTTEKLGSMRCASTAPCARLCLLIGTCLVATYRLAMPAAHGVQRRPTDLAILCEAPAQKSRSHASSDLSMPANEPCPVTNCKMTTQPASIKLETEIYRERRPKARPGAVDMTLSWHHMLPTTCQARDTDSRGLLSLPSRGRLAWREGSSDLSSSFHRTSIRISSFPDHRQHAGPMLRLRTLAQRDSVDARVRLHGARRDAEGVRHC
jgi:hypothetical protein